VLEEAVSQARAVGCAFDQAWYVGNDKTLVVIHPDHAQIGVQCGEGVVGHLGFSGGNGADEGAFPRVG